jgi:hypothetical protein
VYYSGRPLLDLVVESTGAASNELLSDIVANFSGVSTNTHQLNV